MAAAFSLLHPKEEESEPVPNPSLRPLSLRDCGRIVPTERQLTSRFRICRASERQRPRAALARGELPTRDFAENRCVDAAETMTATVIGTVASSAVLATATGGAAAAAAGSTAVSVAASAAALATGTGTAAGAGVAAALGGVGAATAGPAIIGGAVVIGSGLAVGRGFKTVRRRIRGRQQARREYCHEQLGNRDEPDDDVYELTPVAA